MSLLSYTSGSMVKSLNNLEQLPVALDEFTAVENLVENATSFSFPLSVHLL